jgi:hypothetical protein
MPRYAGVGCRLRQAFEDIPPSLLPRPMRPVRLTSEEARLNYMFVKDGGDSVEILHRVRRGVKPVGTVLVKLQDVRFATDRAAVGAIKAFGLG